MAYKSFRSQVEKELKDRIGKSLDEVGKHIADDARRRVPVDTGTLKGTIDYEIDEDKNRITIGANTDYAINVEKGSSNQKAQPFITPAVMSNIKEIESTVEDNMKG